jgi:hypothetical protein
MYCSTVEVVGEVLAGTFPASGGSIRKYSSYFVVDF